MIEQREPHWSEGAGNHPDAARTATSGEAPDCGLRETRTLRASLLAPAEARSFVAERICRRHDPLAVAAAALVASELVTHAVRTGDGPIRIDMQCQVSTLTLSVTFSTEGPAGNSRLRLADPVADMIVDRICRSTGALSTADELTMWATIPTGYLPAHVSVHDVPQQASETWRLQQSDVRGS